MWRGPRFHGNPPTASFQCLSTCQLGVPAPSFLDLWVPNQNPSDIVLDTMFPARLHAGTSGFLWFVKRFSRGRWWLCQRAPPECYIKKKKKKKTALHLRTWRWHSCRPRSCCRAVDGAQLADVAHAGRQGCSQGSWPPPDCSTSVTPQQRSGPRGSGASPCSEKTRGSRSLVRSLHKCLSSVQSLPVTVLTSSRPGDPRRNVKPVPGDWAPQGGPRDPGGAMRKE